MFKVNTCIISDYYLNKILLNLTTIIILLCDSYYHLNGSLNKCGFQITRLQFFYFFTPPPPLPCYGYINIFFSILEKIRKIIQKSIRKLTETCIPLRHSEIPFSSRNISSSRKIFNSLIVKYSISRQQHHIIRLQLYKVACLHQLELQILFHNSDYRNQFSSASSFKVLWKLHSGFQSRNSLVIQINQSNFDNSIRNDNNPSLSLHIKFEVFKTIPKLNPNTLHHSKHHLKASTAISLLSEVISPEHFSQISLHYAHPPPPPGRP